MSDQNQNTEVVAIVEPAKATEPPAQMPVVEPAKANEAQAKVEPPAKVDDAPKVESAPKVDDSAKTIELLIAKLSDLETKLTAEKQIKAEVEAKLNEIQLAKTIEETQRKQASQKEYLSKLGLSDDPLYLDLASKALGPTWDPSTPSGVDAAQAFRQKHPGLFSGTPKLPEPASNTVNMPKGLGHLASRMAVRLFD